MKRSRLIVSVALLVGGSVVQAGETGAQAVDSAWVKAMKAQSRDAVMALYAPDAVAWFPGEAEAKGETAIRDSYTTFFASNTVADAVLSDTHYKMAGNASVGWGKFALTVVDKATSKTNVWTGRFTDVAERRGAKWVYIVDHASAEPAAK
jgi:ketosteroid isomerase-like protein